MSGSSTPSGHPGFAGQGLTKAWVLGSNGNLWFEQGPWGKVPPARQQVGAGGVAAFSPIGQSGQALVLNHDGRLWLHALGQGAAGPEVDGNVAAFDGNVTLGQQQAYVLGTDGSLWLEHGPWGTVPPARQLVDRNVQAFQTINANQVFVLGTDGSLWLESAPWGSAPPHRIQVGSGGITAFQATGSVTGAGVFILGTDEVLRLVTVGGTGEQEVGGGGILAFDVVPHSDSQVFVLAQGGTVWLNTVGQGSAAPQIDANAAAIQAIDANHLYVLGQNGSLWLEQGPWGTVPPARQQVDGSVSLAGDPSLIIINSYPNISGLNGHVSLTIEPSGAYTFTGSWSPSNPFTGGVAQDVSLMLGVRDAQGALWTFSTAGTVPVEGSYNFSNSGTNASLAKNYDSLLSGYGWRDSYSANLDLASTWQQLQSLYQQNQQAIDEVIAVVGFVASL